ncbi:MAG: hypothetical protein KGL39_12615 [Patescibacteria group bacterium]|nr:hypothetical protein [Patescibacteria group bacterium]
MARDWFINGESLVFVKSHNITVGTTTNNLTELGLSEGPIKIRPNFFHQDLTLDAWGGEVPAEVQVFLTDVDITMSLVHFDRSVLDSCLLESIGGPSAIGQTTRAGSRLGYNPITAGTLPPGRKDSTYHYIDLFIASPVASKPWHFFYTYLTGPPMDFPLGTEKSIVHLNWKAIPWPDVSKNTGVNPGDPARVDSAGTINGASGQPIWAYDLTWDPN